jgi:bile acid-coenzyme A ligase
MRSFGETIAALAAGEHADDPAISYPDRTISWREFADHTAARAHRLIELGVKPDDMVAIALPNSVEHHISSFAAWRAGATASVLPTKLPGRELTQVIELAAPKVLIRSQGEPLDGVVELLPGTDVLGGAIPPDLAAAHWKAVTSGGSTGRPKLIVDHAEARYGERLKAIAALVGMPREGVMLNPGPLYHNAPFLFTSLALLGGTCVVGMNRFDPEEALSLIERERVGWVCMVPTMMHRVWSLPSEVKSRYDLSSLLKVVHVGAPCAPWLKRAWIDWLGPDRVLELYAGTEGAAVAISGEEWLRKPGAVGKVSAETLVIKGPDGEICPAGTVGEIYFAQEAAARFHYVGAVPRLDATGRMSLGDLGYVDAEGYLFLADRRTDLIVRGGANIYPAEVEAALLEHPDVAEAVVIGVPCEEYGARVHAIVQLRRDASVDVDAVRAFMRERLVGYKCPETYAFVDHALRDEAGKVRRQTLRDAAADPALVSRGS